MIKFPQILAIIVLSQVVPFLRAGYIIIVKLIIWIIINFPELTNPEV